MQAAANHLRQLADLDHVALLEQPYAFVVGQALGGVDFVADDVPTGHEHSLSAAFRIF